MKKAFFFCFLLGIFLLPVLSYSQNKHKTDSLKQIVNNKALHDTTRARAVLLYVAEINKYSDSNIAILVWADSLSRKYNNEKLTANLVYEKLNLYRGGGDPCREKLFREATALVFYCHQHHDTLFEAKGYFTRASAYWNYNMTDKAIAEQIKAANLFMKTDNLHTKAYNIYLVGYYMFNNDQYTEALPYFIKAYGMSRQENNKGMMLETSGWIGNTYNALKKFDSAIYYRHLSLSYVKDGVNGARADGYRYLGNIYQNMGMLDSALTIYQRSVKMFIAVGNNALLEKYFIAKIYSKQGKYQLASKALDQLFDTVKHYNNPLVKYLSTELAGDVYDKAGEPSKAILAYRNLVKMNDSIQKSDKADNVTEMNAKMQFEQAEQMQQVEEQHRADLAQKDKQKEVFIRNVFIAGFICLLFFGAIMYRNFLQKKKANILLVKQKELVEEKNKEILDSITYAKRLQDAILPPLGIIKKYIPESFLLYKPKDIVAGDFYWMERSGDTVLIAAADCTGHGVPGALVSVICSNALNRTVKEFRITEPGKILDKVRELVLETFEKSENNVQDGMDISLCCINTKTKEIQWSGAYNSLWYIQHGEMKEVLADKQPIGKNDKPTPFHTHNLNLQSGDTLYLFTDGYADQFGGPKGKKFKYKQLQEILLANTSRSMEEQKTILEGHLDEWKGSLEQVDDVLIIGIRV